MSSGQPRSLLFPGVLALVVILGTSLVVYARSDRRSDDLGGVPQLGDHIHQAVGVNVCGEWLPDLPEFESPAGIHTHGDGVIHAHPFSQLGVGANATLGLYLKDARDDGGLKVSLNKSKLVYLGKTYEEGKTPCKGVDDPELRVAYWSDVQDASSKPEVRTGGFNDMRLTTDGAGFTIFYGDPDADIPKPPHAKDLDALGAADGGQVPNAQGDTSTSAPADGSSSTSVAGEPSATTAPPAGDTATTATTAAP